MRQKRVNFAKTRQKLPIANLLPNILVALFGVTTVVKIKILVQKQALCNANPGVYDIWRNVNRFSEGVSSFVVLLFENQLMTKES